MANFRGSWQTWRTSGAIGAGWIQKGERIGQIQYKVNKSQKGKGSYSKQQGIAILDLVPLIRRVGNPLLFGIGAFALLAFAGFAVKLFTRGEFISLSIKVVL